jgi:hypothetical protein
MLNGREKIFPPEREKTGKLPGNSPDEKLITHKINMLFWKKYFSAKVGNGCHLPRAPGPSWPLVRRRCQPPRPKREPSAKKARYERPKEVPKKININKINIMPGAKK